MKKISLVILCLLLSSQSVFASFPDVPPNEEYSRAVDWMERNGIVEGYYNGTFLPNSPVSRAEFIKMLYLTMEKEVPEVPLVDLSEIFNDGSYSGNSWFKKYISQAYLDGVAVGYPSGGFYPGANINFAEASKMIANAFFNADNVYNAGDLDGANVNVAGGCVLQARYYTDQWFWPYVGILDSACIYPDSTIEKADAYHPSMYVSRGQMAFMLYAAKMVVEKTEMEGVYVGRNGLAVFDSHSDLEPSFELVEY
jgi:hypothetical protein